MGELDVVDGVEEEVEIQVLAEGVEFRAADPDQGQLGADPVGGDGCF